jgi:phospholipid/cholesterol/gamma-HCH transport system permease protein
MHHYWYNSQRFVHSFDLFSGIFKSIFFGAAIALVSCYRGFHCTPGAEGVGRAATAAFVWSFVLILVIDLLLAKMMYTMYYQLFPNASKLF